MGEGIRDGLRSSVAGSLHPPTYWVERTAGAQGLILEQAEEGDAEMLLSSPLRFICQQKQNTNAAFPTAGLGFHLAASEPSTLSGPAGLSASESGLCCQR